MASSILWSFRRIALTGLAVAMIFGSAVASAGTASGLLLGALLFGGHSHTTVVNKLPDTGQGRTLFDEYKENQALIAQKVPESNVLERRNQQIQKILVEAAREDYIDGFEIDLVPLATKQIQEDSVPDSPVSWLVRLGSLSGVSKQDTTTLKQIMYEIKLSGPDKINSFDVWVNGKKLAPIAGKYQFDITQSYGKNNLVIDLQSRVYKDLTLQFDRSTYISSPAQKAANRDSPENFIETLSSLFPLMFLAATPILFILGRRYIRGEQVLQ